MSEALKPVGDAALEKIDENLLERSREIVDDILSFADEDSFGAEATPASIERFGKARGLRRHRIAEMARMSTKDAPVGLKHAMALYTAAQARGDGAARPTLNVAVVIGRCDAPPPEYEVIEES